MIRSLSLILSLAVAVPVAQAADDAAAVARLQAYLDGAHTLSARFSQTLIDEDGTAGQRSEGLLHLERPGRFRWDYRAPYQQLIVSDGRQVWMYDPELAQVTVQALDETLASSPAMLLSGSGDVREAFRIRQLQRDDGLYWLELEPRVADSDFQRVQLGLDGDHPVLIELLDSLGQTTRIRLDEVELGGAMDPALFRFEPPPGTDLIGEPAAEDAG